MPDILFAFNFSGADVTFVSVHIRRTDYSRHLSVLYKEKLLDAPYFERAMDYFRKQVVDPAFVVVSDDINWAKANFKASSDIYYVGTPNQNITAVNYVRNPNGKPGKDIGNDLCLLSMVNHSIMSYGSYGMWGALLAGGKTVMPEHFKEVKESKEIIIAALPGWVFL